MLLTAQRVVGVDRPGTGVNVYQYLHGPYTWERVPDQFVPPETNPGELVAEWIQLPPGGNRIISFLDVVVPDKIAVTLLQQRLTSMKYQLTRAGSCTVELLDPIWARFQTSVSNSLWSVELAALAGHIALCIEGAAPSVSTA